MNIIITHQTHGTEVSVRVHSLPCTLSRAQTLRIRLSLCTRAGCYCKLGNGDGHLRARGLQVGETRDGRITLAPL